MPDVEVAITVPSVHTARVLAALDAVADTDLVLVARGSRDLPSGEDYFGKFHVRINEKDVGESNKGFAERFAKELLRTIVRLHEHSTDTSRHKAETEAIDPVSTDVPDEVAS